MRPRIPIFLCFVDSVGYISLCNKKWPSGGGSLGIFPQTGILETMPKFHGKFGGLHSPTKFMVLTEMFKVGSFCVEHLKLSSFGNFTAHWPLWTGSASGFGSDLNPASASERTVVVCPDTKETDVVAKVENLPEKPCRNTWGKVSSVYV